MWMLYASLGALIVGALLAGLLRWVLARRGEPIGPVASALCALAIALAFNPFVPHFVATREELSRDRYLDDADLGRALVGGVIVVALACLPIFRSAERLARVDLAAAGLRAVWGPVLAALLLPSLLDPSLGNELPLTNDEHAYLYQAELFARMEQTESLGALAEFFTAPQTQVADGQVFSKYPPGHSALLAPGTWLGWPPLIPRLLAALCPLLVYLLARRMGSARPHWAAWLMALSPWFLSLEALQLSHGTSLPLTLLFVYAGLRALEAAASRPAQAMLWSLLAGVAISTAFAARPVTALAIGVPVLVQLLRERPRGAWKLISAVLVACVPAAVLFFTANAATTGSGLTTAYGTYNKVENALYGSVEALSATLAALYNLGRAEAWLVGLAPGLALVVLGIARSPAQPSKWLFVSLPLVLFAAYCLHPFHGIPWCGPVYLSEGLPYLVLFAAAGLECVERAFGARRLAVLALGMLVTSLWLLQSHHALARDEIREREAHYAAAQAAGIESGVIFVDLSTARARKLHPLQPPRAGSRLVFARDRGSRNAVLLDSLGNPPAWRYDPQADRLTPLAP
jgi:hypothetical protein